MRAVGKAEEHELTKARNGIALRADLSGPPLVPGMRRDRTCRVFTPKVRVVVHNLAHQLLDHLLTDEPILLARQFCDCLRDRINDFICFRGIDFV